MFLPGHDYEPYANILNHFPNVAFDGMKFESLPFSFAEIEQLIDECRQAVGIADHRVDILLGFRVESVFRTFCEIFQRPSYQRQRRTYFMGHIREKIELRNIKFTFFLTFDLFDRLFTFAQRATYCNFI